MPHSQSYEPKGCEVSTVVVVVVIRDLFSCVAETGVVWSWPLCGLGTTGLYRGYFATLVSFGPFSALYFMLFEQLKRIAQMVAGLTTHQSLPFGAALVCSASAGSMAALATNVIDTAKA